jgi:hypothetical protein
MRDLAETVVDFHARRPVAGKADPDPVEAGVAALGPGLDVVDAVGRWRLP